MKTKPRSPKQTRRLQSAFASVRALRTLEAAARRDIAIARTALDLLDALIGTQSEGVFPRHAWSLPPNEELPRRVAEAVRFLIRWALGGDAPLEEVFASRVRVLEAIVVMRRESPFGKRCLKVVNALRKKYPAEVPPQSASGDDNAANGAVRIIENAVGRPLNGLTLRLAEALGPTTIRIVGRDDSVPWRLAPGTVTIQLGDDGFTVRKITWAAAVGSTRPAKRIEGVLIDYFETGTEGVLWSLMDEENLGYKGLHLVEPGDHLTICDALGRKEWSGTIRCDRRIGWKPYPGNPKQGQPVALGCWVHWTQRGFTPDQWAGFFIRSDVDRFRGILTKKAAGVRVKRTDG